jgi:hypothetical protein
MYHVPAVPRAALLNWLYMLGFVDPRRLLLALLAAALVWPVTASGQEGNGSAHTAAPPRAVTYNYTVEWRLIDAGKATLSIAPAGTPQYPSIHSELTLASAGLVSKLYKVNDRYFGNYSEDLCAISYQMSAEEGRRRRDTKVTYDRTRKKATYLERDLVKNSVVHDKEIEIPGCVHDVIGALMQLRASNLEPGKSAEFPVSDGKKFGMVRVEAQEREQVNVSGVKHKTVRYEAFIFNGVIYPRKARLLVWLTDDEHRLPVQIRVRMNFPIGNVTLNLDGHEYR